MQRCWTLAVVSLVACSSDSTQSSCVAGSSRACNCADGGKGIQICQPGGAAWGSCLGCSSIPDGRVDANALVGKEGGPCGPGGACERGLVCRASDATCVRAPDARPADAREVGTNDAPGKTDTSGKTDGLVKVDAPPAPKLDGKGDSCKPETNIEFCYRLGKACGQLSGTDNCGSPRTVPNCGTCPSPQSCSGNACVGPCDGALKDKVLSKGSADTATWSSDTLVFTLKDVDISQPQALITFKENAGTPYDMVLVKNVSETTGNQFVVTVVDVNNSAATARVCIKHK